MSIGIHTFWFKKNAFENVCEMANILSLLQCFKIAYSMTVGNKSRRSYFKLTNFFRNWPWYRDCIVVGLKRISDLGLLTHCQLGDVALILHVQFPNTLLRLLLGVFPVAPFSVMPFEITRPQWVKNPNLMKIRPIYLLLQWCFGCIKQNLYPVCSFRKSYLLENIEKFNFFYCINRVAIFVFFELHIFLCSFPCRCISCYCIDACTCMSFALLCYLLRQC